MNRLEIFGKKGGQSGLAEKIGDFSSPHVVGVLVYFNAKRQEIRDVTVVFPGFIHHEYLNEPIACNKGIEL